MMHVKAHRFLLAGAFAACAGIAGGGCSSKGASPMIDAASTGAGGTSGAAPDGASGGSAGTSSDAATPSPPDATAAADIRTDGPLETRLVPWQLEAPGTDPLVMGVFDTAQHVVCNFVLDTTGQLRCLPPVPLDLNPTTEFSDAACTKMIYELPTSEVATVTSMTHPVALPLPLSRPIPACAKIQHTVGTLKVFAPTGASWQGSPCMPATDSGALYVDQGETYMTAEPTDLNAWVAGTAVEGPLVGDRLRLMQIESTDGARFDDHMVDTRWNTPCDLSAQAGVCLPPLLPAPLDAARPPNAHSSDVILFGDNQCKTTQLVPAGSVCNPAFIASTATEPYRAIGDAWTGPVFDKTYQGCVSAAESSTSGNLFVVGPALDDAAAMPVGWMVSGTGRLRQRELTGPIGPIVPVANWLTWPTKTVPSTPRFHDTALNEDCNPVWTPEGLVRCVSANVNTSYSPTGFFADSACKTPGYFCFTAGCATEPMMDIDTDLSTGYRGLAIHMLVSAPSLYEVINGVCVHAADDSGMSVYVAGPTLPWDTFPTLTEVNAR